MEVIKQHNLGSLALIEPDSSVRDALSTLLRGNGWTVICHKGVKQLQDTALSSLPVAVISESHLPDGSAEELLKFCKLHNLPVIFTGHDTSTQSAVDLVKQGAVDFLDKPFAQSRLIDLLIKLPKVQNRDSRQDR